jgi:hypothetical protein
MLLSTQEGSRGLSSSISRFSLSDVVFVTSSKLDMDL